MRSPSGSVLRNHNYNVMVSKQRLEMHQSPRLFPVPAFLQFGKIDGMIMAAAAKIALGHELDSSDGSPGRSDGSTKPSSEVLELSPGLAGQFDTEVSTRSHCSSLTLQLRINPRMDASLRGRYPGGN